MEIGKSLDNYTGFHYNKYVLQVSCAQNAADGLKRRCANEKNISAEKKTEKQRAWLPEKNENQKWKKGSGQKKIERQKKIKCLHKSRKMCFDTFLFGLL